MRFTFMTGRQGRAYLKIFLFNSAVTHLTLWGNGMPPQNHLGSSSTISRAVSRSQRRLDRVAALTPRSPHRGVSVGCAVVEAQAVGVFPAAVLHLVRSGRVDPGGYRAACARRRRAHHLGKRLSPSGRPVSRRCRRARRGDGITHHGATPADLRRQRRRVVSPAGLRGVSDEARRLTNLTLSLSLVRRGNLMAAHCLRWSAVVHQSLDLYLAVAFSQQRRRKETSCPLSFPLLSKERAWVRLVYRTVRGTTTAARHHHRHHLARRPPARWPCPGPASP